MILSLINIFMTIAIGNSSISFRLFSHNPFIFLDTSFIFFVNTSFWFLSNGFLLIYLYLLSRLIKLLLNFTRVPLNTSPWLNFFHFIRIHLFNPFINQLSILLQIKFCIIIDGRLNNFIRNGLFTWFMK